MGNTINTVYDAQVLVGQNGHDTTSTSAATQSENNPKKSTTTSSIPQDILTISDKAKTLASSSQSYAGSVGGAGGKSSVNDTEDLIEKLKEKIAQLEKEIAKEKNSSKGSEQTIKIKEALLTSYQAQLAALLTQASEG